MGEGLFALFVVGLLLASFFVWLSGTFLVFYAIFTPRKVAEDPKAKRMLIAYFVNATLCGLAFRFPDGAHVVRDAIKAAFVSSTPYAEGGLALILLALIWLSPFIVIGFIVWLLIDVISSATASKVQRKLKDRQ